MCERECGGGRGIGERGEGRGGSKRGRRKKGAQRGERETHKRSLAPRSSVQSIRYVARRRENHFPPIFTHHPCTHPFFPSFHPSLIINQLFSRLDMWMGAS